MNFLIPGTLCTIFGFSAVSLKMLLRIWKLLRHNFILLPTKVVFTLLLTRNQNLQADFKDYILFLLQQSKR